MGEEASDNVSLDSVASSTASDVLIRSTSLHATSSQRKGGSRLAAADPSPLHPGHHHPGASRMGHSRLASGNGSACQDSDGRRLRQVPAPVLPDFAFKKRDPGRVPPALPANQCPAAPLTDDAINGSTVQKIESTSQKVLVTKHFPDPTDEKKVIKEPLGGSKQKRKDVEISHFTTGHKETLLAALNKRAQSGPGTKHVPVQLLGDIAGRSQQTEKDRETSEIQTASIAAASAAAATAAAIAAAAPVLKVQSNLEAQVNSVSQLLHKLQEADKQLQILTDQHSKIQSQPAERVYQGRVSELERQLTLLTEQRLQHLEKLQQQQLEMQAQFMTSAIKASASHREAAAPACSHLPTTLLLPQTTAPPKISEKVSPPAVAESKSDAGKSPLETPAPRRFAPVPISMDVQVPSTSSQGKENAEEPRQSTSGKVHFLQEILGHDNAPVSRSTYKTHTPLNLTTSDSQPFSDSYLQKKHGYAAGTSSLLPGSTAVQKADDVLQDLGALKQEMQSMMKDARQWKTQEVDLQPREKPTLLSTSLSKSPVIWRRNINPPKSVFEDAECVLREVQNKRRVLEDNLEAIARANDWARRYTLISTLATDSDVAEKIRLQKLVDSMITEITAEVQDEMAKEDSKKKKSDESGKESAARKNAGNAKDLKDNRYIKAPASRSVMRSTKPSSGVSAEPPSKRSGEKLAGSSGRVLSKKDGSSKGPQKADVLSVMDEDMLNRVYGTPVYQGHRGTLKKGPYLRFGSPPAKPKPQRPKVLETVRGVKLKSAKIQTTTPDMERVIVKSRSPEYSAPKSYEPQYAFIPSGETCAADAPVQGHLIEMAIPLGKPRFGRSAPLPSAVILAHPQPVVNVSIPPKPPKPMAQVVKPNIAVIEIRSEKKDPPQLSVQVLPCVDIDSVTSDSPGTTQRSPSPDPPPRTPSPVKTDIQMPENVETEEEVLALPGSSLQEADVTPDEQVGEVPEPLLELDGFGDLNPPQSGGIPFPPPAPALQTDADVLDGITLRRETMVNRLAGRLEQEIFDRVISEMQSKRQDLVPHVTPSSSESGESVSSDVDAPGVPIESGLIRQYVEEFLAEKVSMILAERKPQRAAASPPEQSVVQPVEMTPVPTPQCTPPSSPEPPPRETIVRTPELSPHASLDEPEPQQEPGKTVPLTPVVTPTMTPVASPSRANTPISLTSEDHEEPSSVKSPRPNAWDNTELPLEEENPHSLKEAVLYRDAVVMTVAEEEEPKSLISVPSEPQKPIVPSPPRDVTSAHSSSSSSTSTEKSVTESDTPDKALSEGEVLYSDGQIIVPRDLAAGGLVYPSAMESLSSTLKDANDMEFDAPSEGQVMDRGARHDPIRSLLAKLNQDPVSRQEVFYHPESSGEENSMGEISEGQRPRLTPAAQQILGGNSAFTDRGQTAGHPRRHPSPHGPQMNIPGESQGDAEDISSGPLSLGDLEARLLPAYYPHAEDLHQIPAAARNTSQGPGEPQREHQPVPTRFIQVGVKSSDDPQQVLLGTQEDSDRTIVEPSMYLTNSGEASESPKKMSVTLPSMIEDDEDVKTTFLESDSSGADTF